MRKLFLSFIYYLLLNSQAFCGIETEISYLNGTDFLSWYINGNSSAPVPNTFSYIEIPYFNPSGNSNWENQFKIKSTKGRVSLYIDPAIEAEYPYFKLTLPVHIHYYGSDHVQKNKTHTFIVDYNPVEGSSHRQLDLWQLEGIYAINARVQGNESTILIESTNVSYTLTPADINKISSGIKLKTELEYDKVVDFDYQKILEWNQVQLNYDPIANQMKICWDVIRGAELYDLEWGFVERYNDGIAFTNTNLTTSTHDFNKNSTRVTITQNCYTMPIVYEQGALIFRVRGRGKVLPDLENEVIGKWSCGKWANTCNDNYSSISPNFNNWHHRKWFIDGHESDNKNWQVVTTYAEEGKRKDVVNYMDGTMRTRQTVTLNNSDNHVLVAETFYDHQGRAAVQVLPAPVIHDPALKYRNNFNRNTLNQPFSKSDFDLDGSPCTGSINPLNDASGAAYYYSTAFYNNLTLPEKASHLGYIPKSDSFPMIQTEYTPDNTGRIQRQGGAGKTFQLESGHETKYFYATPAQEELDYLFGTNVGIASHYKKNMVMDPNGQISISYMDAKGNTIATALAAKAPGQLEQLNSYQPKSMLINLLAYNRKDTINYTLESNFTLAVDTKGPQKFYYGVTAEQFHQASCMPADVCYDCIYDLELLVVSNECPDTLFHLQKTIGSFVQETYQAQAPFILPYELDTFCDLPYIFNTNLLPANNSFLLQDVPVGTYSVIKRLKVNQTAAQTYLHHYINDPNNVCTDIMEDILQDQLDQINEDDCSIDCDDLDPDTFPEDTLLANVICDTSLVDPCKIAYESMKAHFMPGGQYAEFDLYTYNTNGKPLSILNTSGSRRWPLLSYKQLSFPSSDNVYDDDGNLQSPTDLSVQQFVNLFEESWLETLVLQHPEFCMYDRCIDSLFESNKYSNQLHEINSFDVALASNVIGDNYEILDLDPYFKLQLILLPSPANPGPGQDFYYDMKNRMDHFPHGDPAEYSIFQLAAANSLGVGLPNSIDLADLQLASVMDDQRDQFWMTYKSLYISLKERIEYKLRTSFAMNPGNCYNECIGQESFSPVINGFVQLSTLPPFGFAGEFTNPEEPCNASNYLYFRDKVKAFPSPYDMLPNMDVDFWDAPMSEILDNVLPIIPKNPCENCNCNKIFTDFLNYIIYTLVIPDYNATGHIIPHNIPIGTLRTLFPGIFSEYAFPDYINLKIWDPLNNGNIEITFTDIRCKLKLQLNITDFLAGVKIVNAQCPSFNQDQIVTQFQFEIEMNGRNPKLISANAELCDINCIQEQALRCKDYSEKEQLLSLLNLLQQSISLNSGSGNHSYSIPVNLIGVELKNALIANGFSGGSNFLFQSNKNNYIINIGNGLKNCISLNFNSYLSGGNTHLNTSEISYFSDLIPRYPFAYLNNNVVYDFFITAHFLDGTSTLCSGTSCFGLAACGDNIELDTIHSKKCEASPAVIGLLDIFNHILLSTNDLVLPHSVIVPTVYFGNPLLDSLNINSSISQSSINIIQNSGLNFQFMNCNVKLDFGIHNSTIDINNILFFGNIEPDFGILSADGRAYKFDIKAYMNDGTVINCKGTIVNPCFSAGRCCPEQQVQQQRTTKTKSSKSKKSDTKKIAANNTRKKKFPNPLPTDPTPLPKDPVIPPKPFDPLCDDCFNIDFVGGVFDTVKFPDCHTVMCDSNTWISITLDSMPDPCVEHLYDVAEHNAYVLYEQIMDSITAAFLHAYNMQCLRATEVFVDTSNFGQHHFTLYYYDQSNNLVQTVPPNGVEGLDVTEQSTMWTFRDNDIHHITPNPEPTVSAVKISWTSTYKYNSLNQLREQMIPDQGHYDNISSSFIKDSTLFWYDYLGRLVCSQNPEQQLKKEYSYTLYDKLGRITQVGALDKTLGSAPPSSPINTNGSAWINFLNSPKSQITRTIYDRPYNSAAYPPGFLIPDQSHLRGRVSAAAYFDTQSSLNVDKPESSTLYSYDIHGNVRSLIQDAKGFPHKRMDYDYDLISGKVNRVWYQKDKDDQFIHRYHYDADNRLTEVFTSQSGIIWDRDAAYHYYPHGPLARTELGENEVQGLDYAYTLQGWIKGMNSGSCERQNDMGKDGSYAYQHSSFAQDEVGYVLHYYEGDYSDIRIAGSKFETNMTGTAYNSAAKNLYNGNIRAMITGIDRFRSSTGIAGYAYQYDQLNRIKGMDYFQGLYNNSWSSATSQTAYQTRYSYDANGNLEKLNRKGSAATLDMDEFVYHYDQKNNRLTHVDDAINPGNYTTDIDDQKPNNYEYDRNGNLIRDHEEGLSIEWNLSGKVSKIKKDNGDIILFRYDQLGNRIMKSYKDTATWYVRDANGNVMSHYQRKNVSPPASSFWRQSSVTLYGSSRLGELEPVYKDPLIESEEVPDPSTGSGSSGSGGIGARKNNIPKPLIIQHHRGNIQYELTNHLGNVLVTVSDRKRWVGTSSQIWRAHLVTAQDYYPEGMLIPQRTYSIEQYHNKHQGQLTDSEVYGEGSSYYYKYRMSDPRLCRFWSVDPLFRKYSHYSNYQFSGNKLISHGELEGLEEKNINDQRLYRRTTSDRVASQWYTLILSFTEIGKNALKIAKFFVREEDEEIFVSSYKDFNKITLNPTKHEFLMDKTWEILQENGFGNINIARPSLFDISNEYDPNKVHAIQNYLIQKLDERFIGLEDIEVQYEANKIIKTNEFKTDLKTLINNYDKVDKVPILVPTYKLDKQELQMPKDNFNNNQMTQDEIKHTEDVLNKKLNQKKD